MQTLAISGFIIGVAGIITLKSIIRKTASLKNYFPQRDVS
jgi:hypothetical protein